MATSGVILPMPKWYFVDNNGKPLGSGLFYTFQSLNKNILQPIYQDPGLTLPYTDPVHIDANGTAGPFFFDPGVNYYLVVTAVDGDLGHPIWSLDNYNTTTAGGGGGGGPSVTTYIDLENLVINNSFYMNNLTPTGSINPQTITPVPSFITLAPGAHTGLYGTTAQATTTGSPASDITFIKTSGTQVDSLTFGTFGLGSTALTPDVTPVYFLNYTSTAGSGETSKYLQFPITSDVTNLTGQATTGSIWIRWNSGPSTITVQYRQFFGDGGSGSPDRVTSVPIVLTTDGAWHRYPIALSVPNASGAVYGECGNDGLFFQIQYPINAALSFDITKPSMYVGNFSPEQDFHANDPITSIVNDSRTGDVRSSLNSFAPFGWVPCNDGTIGSATSGATNRANRDTFPLYATLWNGVADGFAPVSGGRGVSAVSDFANNKTITLTRMLGRVLGGAGTGGGLTARALGQYLGEEFHTQTINEMPQHNHPGSTITYTNNTPAHDPPNAIITRDVQTGTTGLPLHIAAQGGGVLNTSGAPFNVMQPTSFVNMFIKL